MRKIVFITFFMVVFSACSQEITKKDIVGIWQLGFSELNSGWFDNYQFFPNGDFKFNTNQYDATNRVISFGGQYEIDSNILILEVSFITEIFGGSIVRSETAGGSGWELIDGTIETKYYKSKSKIFLTLENYCESEGISCIFIDKMIYFKLENDPNNYN
jgi:hypothetical protein